MTKKTTHFGYQKIDSEKKSGKVDEVFHSVATRYDLMNDLMSMGVHRLWKRFTVELSGARRGQTILDLAGGTGDLALHFSKIIGDEGQVVLTDINASMLSTGRDRIIDSGGSNNIVYTQANAENLPFAENSFDCVTMAFGLRNVTDKDKALASINRVLKPSGRLLVLEFSKPRNKLFSKVYNAYSFSVLPKIGKLVAKDEDSYQYLAESIRMHPDQETLKDMMQDANFEQCSYHNLTGGVVALHKGIKV